MVCPTPETKARGLLSCWAPGREPQKQCRRLGVFRLTRSREQHELHQCHLEESSIVLIFVSSILHEITPNTLFQRAKCENFVLFSQLPSLLPWLSGNRGTGFVSCFVQTSGSLTEPTDMKGKRRERKNWHVESLQKLSKITEGICSRAGSSSGLLHPDPAQ